MIIAFAREKGLKLDATTSEVIDYINSITENPDIEIELTPEMLANISGGRKSTGARAKGGLAIRPSLSINMDIGNMPETKAA